MYSYTCRILLLVLFHRLFKVCLLFYRDTFNYKYFNTIGNKASKKTTEKQKAIVTNLKTYICFSVIPQAFRASS